LSKLFTLAFLLTLSNLFAQTFPAHFQDGYILVSGRLDGQSIYILLDSGAPGLVLNREHFGDGSQPATCTGINGSFPCATRTVEDFEWLGIHHRRTEAILSDLSFLERLLGRRVDALGGLSLLNGTGLSIDYDAQLLTIAADAPAAKAEPFLRFRYADHLPVVTCKVNGQSVRLALDTGAELHFLFTPTSPESPLASCDDEATPIRVTGTENISQTRYLTTCSLSVGDYWQDARSSFVSAPDACQTPVPGVDGLLGQAFLQQYHITIYPALQRIYVRPRQSVSDLAAGVMP